MIFIITGCSHNYDSGIDRLVAERDSLRQIADHSQTKLADINEAMEILVTSLDSISTQEGVLIVNKDAEGHTLSRRQMRDRIEAFSALLERQRMRIAELSHKLNEKEMAGGDFSRLSALVDNLNAQLEKKDIQINRLRSELAEKNTSIKKLNEEVSNLTESVASLEITNTQLSEALTTQDIIINECFFLAGDTKSLERQGVLKGGFLKKKKLNYDAFVPGNFMSVDIRHTTQITRKAKKAELLTPAPSASYEIIRKGDDVILNIIDPTAFWSQSNYQVLKLN